MAWDSTRDLARAFAGDGTITVAFTDEGGASETVGGFLNLEDMETMGPGGGQVQAAGTVVWIHAGTAPLLQAALRCTNSVVVLVDGVRHRARLPRRQAAGAYLQLVLVEDQAEYTD